jgi:hypothetical protein
MEPISSEPGLQARLAELLMHTERGAIDLLIALAVVLVGWALAAMIAWVVRGILRLAHFDDGVRRVFGPQAAGDREPSDLAGWVLYWLVLAWSGLFALETLGFELRASLADRMLEVIPRIVAAAALLVLGGVIALLVGRVATRFFESGGLGAARLRGQGVTLVLLAFTGLLALDQLGFAAQFVMAAGLIALAGAALALGLAFGLGCRDLVREFVVEYLRSLEDRGLTRTP